MSSHGGNTGSIAVKDASFELKDSNEDWQNAGTMTAEGTGKLITNDFKNTGDGKVVLKSLESTFETPAGLPAGYMGDGGWTRKEESALA